MTVSSTSDFILNRNQILYAVLRKVTGDRNGWDAEEITNAAQALNLVVKALQNHSVLLWTTEWTTKTLTASSEVTGSDGLNYTCRRSHTAASTNKPVTGADWTTYWEQSGTGGIAWVDTTAYTSIGDFTLASDIIGIQTAFQRTAGNTSDNPIEITSWLNYMAIPDKHQTGVPQKVSYKYDLNGISRGYLWPQPENTDYVIHLETVRRLRDFDQDSDTPDFPSRWFEYLIYQTSYRLAPEYNISSAARQMLKQDATECFMLARKMEFEKTDDDFIEPI